MSQYYTPIKQTYSITYKPIRSGCQAREGDWVCLNCNNLNFSFRKKCNRCKTQTRQNNENSAAYFYNIYNQHMIYSQKQQSHTTTSANSLPLPSPHTHASDNKNLTLSEKSINLLHKTPEKKNKDLPSVSPLVKKYNSRQGSAISQCSQDSVWGVSVGDFMQQPKEDQQQENGYENSQLQQLINKIML